MEARFRLAVLLLSGLTAPAARRQRAEAAQRIPIPVEVNSHAAATALQSPFTLRAFLSETQASPLTDGVASWLARLTGRERLMEPPPTFMFDDDNDFGEGLPPWFVRDPELKQDGTARTLQVKEEGGRSMQKEVVTRCQDWKCASEVSFSADDLPDAPPAPQGQDSIVRTLVSSDVKGRHEELQTVERCSMGNCRKETHRKRPGQSKGKSDLSSSSMIISPADASKFDIFRKLGG